MTSTRRAEDAEDWTKVIARAGEALAATMPGGLMHTRPYDPMSVWLSIADFATSIDPGQIVSAQARAIGEWGEFWTRAFSPEPADTATPKPKGDRRFSAPGWNDPFFRTISDAYLLASRQLKALVAEAPAGDPAGRAMVGFLLDQYLNAASPANFVMTNPEVLDRTRETGGLNLINGFKHLAEDVATGKGIVKRRSDAGTFVKGETIAATPGSVVFQNKLFQLIQYDPATPDVALEPLLYVPPLVNKFYMIDLQPKSSLVRWLVEQGRTVFVISWVNPDERHRDSGVDTYVLEGIVEAIGAARAATGAPKVDLFSFCLGGTLVALALAWLEAKGRAAEVGTATLIGSMVDFHDMREWAAFVNEAHLDALDAHLDARGYIEATELQQLFSAMRANDLIWSSVVNHYLLDREAPPSDLLYWFEDGSRIPAAFLKSYNRGLLRQNALREPAAFSIGGVPIDLKTIKTPLMVIGLKDDHVSAWSAVYDGTRLFGGQVTFILGGSGHNAGVINPPAAGKHGYWTNTALEGDAETWLAGAEKHAGSWWPTWLNWLAEHGTGARTASRTPGEGGLAAIEPAPGSYAATTH